MSKFVNKLKPEYSTASHQNYPRASFLSLTFRLSDFALLLAFYFALFNIQSCGLDIENPTPPSPPIWVQKSLPEEWPERGIDAHESGGIYLEWEPPLEKDIISYDVQRAVWHDSQDSLGAFVNVARIDMEATPQCEFIDTQVTYRTNYFYRLYKENSAGNISEYSDSVLYYLLLPVSNQLMSPNGITTPLNKNRTLSWTYSLSVEMESYNITILSANNDLLIRENLMPSNYSGGREDWAIPYEIILNSGHTYKWRVECGARYIDGIENAGSESHWATFLYLGN